MLRHSCVDQGLQLRPGAGTIARIGSSLVSSSQQRWPDGGASMRGSAHDSSGGSRARRLRVRQRHIVARAAVPLANLPETKNVAERVDAALHDRLKQLVEPAQRHRCTLGTELWWRDAARRAQDAEAVVLEALGSYTCPVATADLHFVPGADVPSPYLHGNNNAELHLAEDGVENGCFIDGHFVGLS